MTKDNLLILAPMEGVLDHLMRELFTEINPYDLCIAEFIRIIDSLLPKSVFTRVCPELHNNGYTQSKTPVRVQLLGQHPEWMAENAARAIEVGSHGVDINFGCPAKMVNKNKGGAVLLKEPEKIYQIVSKVAQAVPHDELSVKIRLGFDDESLLDEIVDAIVSGNANLLSIHARTKRHGYKPPAYWHYIKNITNKYSIPVIANGEIWDKNSAIECKARSGTNNIMLGRGALALPNLADVIKNDAAPMSWRGLTHLINDYSERELAGNNSFYFSSRLKQWLRYLKIQYPEAEHLFQQIKTLKDKSEILAIVNNLQSY